MSDVLFESLKIGDIASPNRILMAPLTRSRARRPGDVPGSLNATYYAQRASAGLIVSEATQVSQQGRGYAGTPGIHTDEQVAGWRLVTGAVHRAGGLIVAQLWHVGRISHTDLQPGGIPPVAPSAIRADAQTYVGFDSGPVPVSEPRALETEEIPGIVEQYVFAAQQAKAAGFDGVELHGANGYLLDQFTRDGANRRTDAYGGSLDNRLRLPVEVARGVADVWGPGRVGYRISPFATFNAMSDGDPERTFGTLAERLGGLGLAYLHVVERDQTQTDFTPEQDRLTGLLKERFGGVYVANGSYDGPTARARIRAGRADAIAFGRPFIANPDLPARLRVGAELAEPDPATFYGGGEGGYTDYPALGDGSG